MVVDNLEKHGWVRRETHPEDRRVTIVRLTPAGEALIREIFPRQVEAIVQEFSMLTAEEQKELGRLCKKLGMAEKISIGK
jgi:MarR family 2-MHQ and catechol resistance regulon transcriptional repressor